MTRRSQARAVLGITLSVLGRVGLAQAPAYVPTMTFDVASIRESPEAYSYMVTGKNPPHNSLYVIQNYSIQNLLSSAYGVDWHQLDGLPGWGRAMFNVQGRSDAATDEALVKLTDKQAYAEKSHMLQALLVDRFHLKVHWETREMPGYNLVLAKGGSKMTSAAPDPPSTDGAKKPDPPLYQRGDGRRGYQFFGKGATMEMLARTLTSQMAGTVADKTGLAGTYAFTLAYRGTAEDDNNTDPTIWPPIPRALEEQLGLKLERTKVPTPVLVIDHIEKPGDN